MFNLPIALANALPALTNSSRESVGRAPTRASAAPVESWEPTTLTLALIGTSIIAIYLMMRRASRSPTDVPRFTDRSNDQAIAETASDDLEQRTSRGAA
jgi:hypothetical protein